MKKIKVLFSSLILLFASIFILSSCDNNKNPSSYYLNEDGNLIVEYDDGNKEDLGRWNDTIVGSISTISVSDDGYYVVNGVKTDIQAIEAYTVSFDTGFSTKVNSQIVKDGYKVTKPEITRVGYTFDGWFCNDEEWAFNTNVVKNNMTLTAHWTALTYNVKFENSKGDNPSDQVYSFGSDVTLPTVASVDGFTFDGWYNNSTKVSNGNWDIAENVTLVAKWVANNYTISIDPNGGNVSSTSLNVKYGDNYTLPVPTNDFGAFKGWSYNGVQLTDAQGASLNPYNYSSNITVTTNWIEEISTVEQLKSISNGLNGHYRLVTDLDLENEEWTPIGNATNPFTGVFDGNGHTISNLKISTQTQYIGMFGYNKGTIKDLTLSNVDFDIPTVAQNSYIGGLSGYNTGEISNVKTYGDINVAVHSSEYTSYTAGISAINFGAVNNCVNNINIEGNDYSSGVICMLKDEMNLYGYYLNIGSVENCINNGNVSGNKYSSGIICTIEKKYTINQCKNTGIITAVNYAGGIVAYHKNYGMTVKYSQCANLGTITATQSTSESYAGGIVGFGYDIEVTDCYNNAPINGNFAGGISGSTTSIGLIKRVYSSGINNTTNYSCGNISSYFGDGSTIGDSVVYGNAKKVFAGGYATLSNCFYVNGEENGATRIEPNYSKDFFVNTLFWSEDIWNFNENTYPTLKWENTK